MLTVNSVSDALLLLYSAQKHIVSPSLWFADSTQLHPADPVKGL